jgi:hypothetical protein
MFRRKCKMRESKHIRYRYNGDATLDEVETDLHGQKVVPNEGDTLVRRGNPWFVARIEKQETISFPPAIPIYLVYLRDAI